MQTESSDVSRDYDDAPGFTESECNVILVAVILIFAVLAMRDLGRNGRGD